MVVNLKVKNIYNVLREWLVKSIILWMDSIVVLYLEVLEGFCCKQSMENNLDKGSS